MFKKFFLITDQNLQKKKNKTTTAETQMWLFRCHLKIVTTMLKLKISTDGKFFMA